jgi:hypothetical protein
MKGDFSNDRFRRVKHFNRVLKQQGRVDLDADWNEQAAINQYLLRTLIADLLGPFGGPRDHCGFEALDWTALSDAEIAALKAAGLTPQPGDFLIGAGRYYVDGILVENENTVSFLTQPDWPAAKLTTGTTYVAYLDVWERHISWIEDDSIREVALNGPDTCTRAKTTWQVRVLAATGDVPNPADLQAKIDSAKAALTAAEAATPPVKKTIAGLKAQIAALEQQKEDLVDCEDLLTPIVSWTSGTMTARLDLATVSDSPCVLSPDSRYRGLENQLYRIEIHRSSAAGVQATFKWSRENGSVATRWLGNDGNSVKVTSSRGFAAGQWIELTDDTAELLGQPGTLIQVLQTDAETLTLTSAPPSWSASLKNPKIRRWDQKANDELTLDQGAIDSVAGSGETGWIQIENQIEVQFSTGNYRCGDFWLIPARVLTGTIEWPQTADGTAPLALPPKGVHHHYAPLATISAIADTPYVKIPTDCRCRFAPLPCLLPDDV